MNKNAEKNQGAVGNLGEQFRLLQAIELIQSFRETVVVNGEEVDVPVFVPSESDPEAFTLNPILEQQERVKEGEANEEGGCER